MHARINSVYLINYTDDVFNITTLSWRPILKFMKSLCDKSWSVWTFYFILWVSYRVSNVGLNVPLMKEDGVYEIMLAWFKQKGYHHSRADGGVFYIESLFPRDGETCGRDSAIDGSDNSPEDRQLAWFFEKFSFYSFSFCRYASSN